MFKYLELVAKNEKLKKELREMTEERDFEQVRANALDQYIGKYIAEKNKSYREKVGEKEELREKCNLLDRALTNANKVLDEIQEVAESNDYGRPSMKVKKIIELAKTRNITSSIK